MIDFVLADLISLFRMKSVGISIVALLLVYGVKPTTARCRVLVGIKTKTLTKAIESDISWEITNAIGQVVCSSNSTDPDNHEYLQSCKLSPGVYTLQCLDSFGEGGKGSTIEIQVTKYCRIFTSGASMNVSLTIFGISKTVSCGDHRAPNCPSCLGQWSWSVNTSWWDVSWCKGDCEWQWWCLSCREK